MHVKYIAHLNHWQQAFSWTATCWFMLRPFSSVLPCLIFQVEVSIEADNINWASFFIYAKLSISFPVFVLFTMLFLHELFGFPYDMVDSKNKYPMTEPEMNYSLCHFTMVQAIINFHKMQEWQHGLTFTMAQISVRL